MKKQKKDVEPAKHKKKPDNPFLTPRMHEDGRVYGRYKQKPNFQISPEDLARALNGETTSYGHKPEFKKPVIDKAYLTFMFWSGARRLEPSKILKEDMQITKEYICVKIPAFKHGDRAGPLKIPLEVAGAEYIIMRHHRTKHGKAVFPVSGAGAYRIIKRGLGVCPHWLRHNFITTAQQTLEGQPSDVDMKIMSWTGIKRRDTLDHYRMRKESDITDVAESMRKKQ